jgi:hypothetical protein
MGMNKIASFGKPEENSVITLEDYNAGFDQILRNYD